MCTLIHQRVSRAAYLFVRAFFRLARPSARSASGENWLEHHGSEAFLGQLSTLVPFSSPGVPCVIVVARQPVGTGIARIRWSITPNSVRSDDSRPAAASSTAHV